MKKNSKAENQPEWLSTYGILTAERVLERFNVRLSREELTAQLHDSNSRYYHLLTLPMKNLFNGILMNQVYDYQVYAQRVLVDYVLSNPNASDVAEEKEAGTDAEAALERKQEEVIRLGEAFEEKQKAHVELIAESQAFLIEKAPNVEAALGGSRELKAFSSRAEEVMLAFQASRTEFRTLILEVTSLLSVVPYYHIDEETLAESQERLMFNPDLPEGMNPGG